MNFHWFPEIVQFLLSFGWINDFLCVSFFFFNNCDFFKSFKSWNVWCSICYFFNIFQRVSNEILMYYLHIIKFINFKCTIKCLEEGFNNYVQQSWYTKFPSPQKFPKALCIYVFSHIYTYMCICIKSLICCLYSLSFLIFPINRN